VTKPEVACDIETYRNFFLVGLKRLSDGTRLRFELSERSPQFDKDRLRRVLLNHRVVTYNGQTYDVPLIFYALKGASNAQLKQASDRIIQGNVRYWDAPKLLGVDIPRDLDHVDMIEPQPNAFASLKTLNGRLHGKKMQDLPIEPDATLTVEQMVAIAEYNDNDLDATEVVRIALKSALELREALGADYKQNFMSKSDSQIGEAIIKSQVEKATGRRAERVETPAGYSFPYNIPDWLYFEHPELKDVLERLRETQFVVKSDGKVDLPPWLEKRKVRINQGLYTMGIGGLHSNEKECAVVADEEHLLVDYDVSSYYPRIILGSGLYPRSLGQTFLKVFREIFDRRLAAKDRAKDLDDLRKQRVLTAEEEAEYTRSKTMEAGLKISLNGCFGKLGSRYSILYAPHLMIAVTLTGQLALLMLIDRAEAAGIRVVSANTDGIVFHCRRDREAELAAITKHWETETGFLLESTPYAGLYSQSVNSYTATTEKGKVKRKGKLANPGFESPPDIRTQMMTTPSMNICADAVVEYLKHGTPLDQTIRGCTDIRQFVTVVNVQGGGTWRGQYLGKVVRFIWSRDGDAILYSKPHPTTGNFKKVSKTDGCRPVMELPDELPIDIDYEAYINEAREIMMAIGADRRPPPPVKVRVYKRDRLGWLALSLAA